MAFDGRRLSSFRVAHSRADLAELIRHADPRRWQARRLVIAFEATGHLWEAIAHVLTEHGVVLCTRESAGHVSRAKRGRIGRDEWDITDAERSRIRGVTRKRFDNLSASHVAACLDRVRPAP